MKALTIALAALTATGCAALKTRTYFAPRDVPAVDLRGAGSPCVPNVPLAMSALEPRGRELGFEMGAAASVGGFRRHWQGLQRTSFAGSQHLFVSRSGSATAVLVIRLDSLADTGRVVAEIPFAPGFDHAGGLALAGTVLAVPVHGSKRAEVVFYDVRDPERPRLIGAFDHSHPELSPSSNVAAVALTRLADGRYLLVLGVRSSKLVEFHVSTDTSLTSFRLLGVETGLAVRGFQSLSLLTQCDGALYLVGAHNTAIPPPSRGHDHVHWYRLERAARGAIALNEEGERRLRCRHCNLAAAGGVYVTAERRVLIYATEFWSRGSGGGPPWVAVEEFGP